MNSGDLPQNGFGVVGRTIINDQNIQIIGQLSYLPYDLLDVLFFIVYRYKNQTGHAHKPQDVPGFPVFNGSVDYIVLENITHGYSGLITPKTCVPYKVESRFPVGTDAERYLLKAVFQSDDPVDTDYGLAFSVNKRAVGVPYAKVGTPAVKPFEPFGVESRLVYFIKTGKMKTAPAECCYAFKSNSFLGKMFDCQSIGKASTDANARLVILAVTSNG
jgi:hypothetical protein